MKNKNKIIICIFPILITFLFVLFYGMKYAIVDDLLINYIVQGVYGTGKNQIIILPYLSVVFTFFLYCFSNLFSHLNIYLISMYVCLTVSFILLQNMFYSKYKNILLNILLIVFQCILLNYVTYTVIAYLVCFVGILMIYEQSNIFKISGCCFLLLGIAIRKDVFISLLIIFLPIIVLKIFKDKRNVVNLVLSLIIFVMVSLVNTAVVNQYSHTQDYLYWNELSTKIRDYAPIDYYEYEDILASNNISENDLNCLYSWIFCEKDTLGEAQLKVIVDQRNFFDTYELNPLKLIDDFFHQPFYLMFLIFAILILILYKFNNLLIPGIIFCVLGDLGALLVRQRAVDRVFIPLILIGIILVLYSAKEGEMEKRWNNKKLYILLTSCICILTLIFGIKERNWFKKLAPYQVSETYQYVKNRPDQLFVFEGFSGVVNAQHKINQLTLNLDDFNKNIMTLGNWDTFSERYYTQMQQFGIEQPNNFFAHLPEHSNIYFIMREESGKKQIICNWYEEHSNRKVKFKTVDTIGQLKVMKLEWSE